MNKIPTVQLQSISGNQVPATTSLAIAEFTGIRHDNILKSIVNLAPEFSGVNFIKGEYDNRGKSYPMFILDEEFATVLIMGFGTAKAVQWKRAYVQEFQRMRTELGGTKVIRQKGDEYALADKLQKIVLDSKRKELENKEGHVGLYAQISRRTNELAFGHHETGMRQGMNQEQPIKLSKAFEETVRTILNGVTNPTKIKETVETNRKLKVSGEFKRLG